MMYNSNVAVAVKVNGKVIREQGDIVHLPFGSEYSIYIKNLNAVRIQFKLQIDGTAATDDTWIVVPGNASVEMQRFINNGNWDEGNKFKFIERTPEIEMHRGIKAEDGLVRIEWQKELVIPHIPAPIIEPLVPYEPKPWPYGKPWRERRRRTDPWDRPIRMGFSGARKLSSPIRGSAGLRNLASSAAFYEEASLNDTGITVPGSRSTQRFVNAASFATENETHVMVLHLRGQVGTQHVKKVVTVRSKPKCQTCGKTNKPDAQFCNQCGTSLRIYA